MVPEYSASRAPQVNYKGNIGRVRQPAQDGRDEVSLVSLWRSTGYDRSGTEPVRPEGSEQLFSGSLAGELVGDETPGYRAE